MGRNGFLSRLLRDKRGNTFALIAAALIPLLGLIGGGIDMSRLYLTKTRLQHACDAGALAGRKAMGVNAWSTSGTGNSNAAATGMFDGNFQQGDYGTGTRTRSFSESNGAVTGSASAIVPMSVMKAFGMTDRTLAVSCTAKMAIPNTDVMFVLDVTGSMGDIITGDTITKMNGLKKAVKCFYEALQKVNTTAVCGNDPTATTYTGTAQIRMGFVPYSINVNVGGLLPSSYMVDNWNYQSRVPNFNSGGNFTSWTYQQRSVDVSSLKSGSTSVTLNTGTRGANQSATWNGCIEERKTVQITGTPANSDWNPIPSAAYDMDINLIPSTSDDNTRWAPQLTNSVYRRYTRSCGWYSCTDTPSTDPVTVAKNDTLEDMYGVTNPVCPVAAKRLQSWNTASPFETYVNSLSATGNTYHDIGMLWGARLVSPIGMFSGGKGNCTAVAANCTDNLTNIQRHVIFMTDGDTNAINTDYMAYGISSWDQRQTNYNPSNTVMNGLVNTRLQGLCAALKNMNVTVWVISYGPDINATTGSNLSNCASSGKYFPATDSTALLNQFKQIAAAISALRLTN